MLDDDALLPALALQLRHRLDLLVEQRIPPSRLVVAQIDCRLARAIKHDHVSCTQAPRHPRRPGKLHPLTRAERSFYFRVCEKDNVAVFGANLTEALGILPQNHRACFP
jgi:hypothetical protein